MIIEASKIVFPCTHLDEILEKLFHELAEWLTRGAYPYPIKLSFIAEIPIKIARNREEYIKTFFSHYGFNVSKISFEDDKTIFYFE